MIRGLPVLDAHIHLDPHGTPVKAVERFLRRGGTHLVVVNKPYHHIPIRSLDDYIRSFETTVDMCRLANKTGARAWCVIGPYPGDLPSLSDRMGLNTAVDLQSMAMEEAFRMVEEGKALGVGEIGRVHFPVDEGIQNACDELLEQAFKEAGRIKCPVILHTESYHSNPLLMQHLSKLMDRTSFPRHRAVKHYSGIDLVNPHDNLGISLSLQCRRETFRKVLSTNENHLWETDYIDDPERPNVVMPPDTVPRKVKWAYELKLLDEERHASMMIDTPRRILGIDTDQ